MLSFCKIYYFIHILHLNAKKRPSFLKKLGFAARNCGSNDENAA